MTDSTKPQEPKEPLQLKSVGTPADSADVKEEKAEEKNGDISDKKTEEALSEPEEAPPKNEEGEEEPVVKDDEGAEKTEAEVEDATTASASSPRKPVSDNVEEVGAIVLAKVKGYPAWPAIVFPQDALPEDVQASKPRLGSSVAVRFFGEASYSWQKPSDLKILTSADIAKKTKRSAALTRAYNEAAEWPTVEDVLQQIEDAAAAAAEAEAEAEAKLAAKTAKAEKLKAKKASAEKAAAAKKTSSTRSSSAATASGAAGSAGTKRAAATQKVPKASPKVAKKPSAKTDLTLDTEAMTKQLLLLRQRLQRGFLKDPVTSESVAGLDVQLKKLESLKDLSIAIIRQTKINKVLKAILKLDDSAIAEEENYKFKTRSHVLLDEWSKLPDDASNGDTTTNHQSNGNSHAARVVDDEDDEEANDSKTEAEDKDEEQVEA